MYNYMAMPLTYNDDEQSYVSNVSNVSFRSITPNNKYTCDIHHVFFYRNHQIHERNCEGRQNLSFLKNHCMFHYLK